jgi:hypothetical protein
MQMLEDDDGGLFNHPEPEMKLNISSDARKLKQPMRKVKRDEY